MLDIVHVVDDDLVHLEVAALGVDEKDEGTAADLACERFLAAPDEVVAGADVEDDLLYVEVSVAGARVNLSVKLDPALIRKLATVLPYDHEPGERG